MSRGDWLIYTTIVKRSTWIMCNILPSLRCIAVRFLPFPLHVPDSRYAHKQNADERQTHIGIRSGAKCPTHRQGRPATSFSDGQSAENEKFHPHFSYSPAGSRPADRRTKKHSRNPYLFPSPKTGTMYDPDAFRRTYDKILKVIGVEHIIQFSQRSIYQNCYANGQSWSHNPRVPL